ncbi:hypothetical protein [Cellulosimicrobium sp. Marseille-Q8652]
MRAERWAALTAAVLSAAVMGGCSADGGAGAAQAEAPHGGTATPRSSPATSAADEELDDAALCVAFGDVLTIVENADLGLADGRTEAQEHDGWYGLATRVLGRLPSTGDSTVRTSIRQLQEIAPAVPPGAFTDSTGVRSPEWDDAGAVLADACDDVGAPLAVSVFTGG